MVELYLTVCGSCNTPKFVGSPSEQRGLIWCFNCKKNREHIPVILSIRGEDAVLKLTLDN